MTKARFVAGNVWLLVALALYVGRTNEYDPVRFFGVGRYMSRLGYGFLTVCCLALGAALLIAALRAKTEQDGE